MAPRGDDRGGDPQPSSNNASLALPALELEVAFGLLIPVPEAEVVVVGACEEVEEGADPKSPNPQSSSSNTFGAGEVRAGGGAGEGARVGWKGEEEEEVRSSNVPHSSVLFVGGVEVMAEEEEEDPSISNPAHASPPPPPPLPLAIEVAVELYEFILCCS